MVVHTVLLDFSVDSESIDKPGQRASLQDTVLTTLQSYINGLRELFSSATDDNGTKRGTANAGGGGEGFIKLYAAERGTIVTVRGFAQGLLTVNIEYLETDNGNAFTAEHVASLENALRTKLECRRSKRLPAIRRGGNISPYIYTSDERILEYDIKEVLYDANSKFQKIQIFSTGNYGNMLVLDDLQNLAESDIGYTETLMQRGKEDYRDKEILILGGGDGALLWELLKEKPKFVTMVEIDDMVMQACKVHLRSQCGTCLDSYSGENYEIVVDDCIKHMRQYIADGRQFDYVFGDLTDIPLSPSPQGQLWDFIRQILDLSFQVLRSDGKFMTHGNGVSSPKALEMYEAQLEKLSCPVEFTREDAFVPSFMEKWVFYQIRKKQPAAASVALNSC